MRRTDGSRCATFQRRAGGKAFPQRWRSVTFSVLVLCLFGQVASAVTLSKGSTSRADREAAERDVPLAELTPEARERVQKVLAKPTVYRRMPVNVVDCDPQLYRFLVRYPEVVVNIWQLMGITKVSATRVGPYLLNASDGAGTVTKIELIYGNQDTHLFYCEGSYDGPLFHQPLTGRCVLLLKSGYKQHEDKSWNVTNRMDVFLQIDNLALDVVTRTLHPLLGKSADLNFVESTNFVERISRTSEENGPGMTRLASRLDQVQPDIRQQFAELTSEVYASSQARDEAMTTAQIADRRSRTSK